MNDLVERTTFSGGPDSPHVCLLDTGVNRGHPLISPSLATADLHTVDPGWGTDDANGHGTEMAGVAIAGNLTDRLDQQRTIRGWTPSRIREASRTRR